MKWKGYEMILLGYGSVLFKGMPFGFLGYFSVQLLLRNMPHLWHI